MVFVNDADQGLYRQLLNPEAHNRNHFINRTQSRYADLQYDSKRKRIVAVEEQHRAGQVINRVVAIGLGNATTGVAAGARRVLLQGEDFYSAPRLSDDGCQMAWICWSHPSQPWTSTSLWLGRLDEQGVPQGQQPITSGQYWGQDEAVVQPEFGPDGSLFFISDRSGWWNLYRYLPTADGYTEALLPQDSEFCRAPWQLGQRAYVILDEQRIGCCWWQQGHSFVGVLELSSRQLQTLAQWPAVHSLVAQQGRLLAVVEPATEPGQIQQWCATSGQNRVLHRIGCSLSGLSPERVIQPRHIEIPTTREQRCFGLLYQPGSVRQSSPMIIQLHGGPTAQSDARFDPLKQFWLQRGFSILDMNYRGSSGYGRAYRHALKGQWGVSEVDDVLAGARYCIEQGWTEPQRIFVRGNSAGGYTALQVLSRPEVRSLICAGASLYGISDLERLSRETHKFEAHYLDWLIGDPQRARINYRLRSPIHRPEDFRTPLIFFQGGLDRVVPATQTYRLFNQLKGRGVTVEYQAFANERHGFRLAANRARVLERESTFYREQLDQLDVDDDQRQVANV